MNWPGGARSEAQRRPYDAGLSSNQRAGRYHSSTRAKMDT
jgi:hypothetical protein